MSVPDLSVCMIVKNEESHLPTFFRSIKDLPCELVVVDTGSTDATERLCREAGAKIIHWKWRNDFAAARNVSLDHATGRWIIWFDADDKVPEESIPRIIELSKGRPEKGYGFLVKNSQEVHTEGSFFSQLRMFPNHPRLRFVSPVHEQIYPALTAAGIPLEYTDLLILHTGYTSTEVLKTKQLRNREILREALKDTPKDAMKWYQVGSAESIQENHATAERDFRRCLELIANGDPNQHLRSIVPGYLALTVAAQRGEEEGLKALLETASENMSEWHPSQILLAARYTTKVKGDEEALPIWERTYDPVMRPTLLPIDSTEATSAALSWLAAFWKDRQGKLAVELLRLLKAYLLGEKQPRRALADRYLEYGLPARAAELYAWCIEMDGRLVEDWAGLVRALRAQGDPSTDQFLAAARERFPGNSALEGI